jgi:RND family efflux transporter MFP subunit
MKKSRLAVTVIIIVLVTFFILKRKIELARAPVFGRRPVLVSVFYSQRKDIKNFREYLAKIESINKAKVSTRVNAMVEKIFVDEGSVVKKGDLLAELDKKDILAKLNSAKQALSADEENFNYWQKEYKRDENLFEQGAISEEERDRVKNNFAQAKAKLENAKENVQFWQANLNYTEIKSPYDGVISKRFVDVGDLATVGKPLFIVEDRSKFKLGFDVPQEDIQFIKKSMPVFYKNKNGFNQAKVTNIFPSIAEGKILHVEAYLDNKDGLYVGAFVPVKVLVAQKKETVVVPKSAVIKMSRFKYFIFIVEGGKLKKYPVVLGLSSDMFVEVKNLSPGVAVVKSPYLSWTKLAEGEPVKIINKR